MADLVPFGELLGFWIGIFLTLCILSFLYKDNPFYKFAEHLFIGVSIGYLVIQEYNNTLSPKLFQRLGGATWYISLIPLALFIMMFVKTVSQRWAWVGRYPLAFVVALFAALSLNGLVQADFGAQAGFAMQSVDAVKVDVNTATPKELSALPGINAPVAQAIALRRAQAPLTSLDQIQAIPSLTPGQKASLHDERGPLVGLDAKASTHPGERDWFGVLSNVLLFLGLLASLIYFYFSIAQKGAIGKVSRFGVWILMIGFGASFGYTVQGRLALAIGRAMDVLGKDKPADLAARVRGPLVALISMAIIIAGIAFFEMRERRRGDGGPTASGSG
jgi:Helix-hairpin-helix motif